MSVTSISGQVNTSQFIQHYCRMHTNQIETMWEVNIHNTKQFSKKTPLLIYDKNAPGSQKMTE
jgi:hypothetical protein